MAAAVSQVTVAAGLAGGLTAFPSLTSSRKVFIANSRVVAAPQVATSLGGQVRCEAGKGLRETIDETTKKDISEYIYMTWFD